MTVSLKAMMDRLPPDRRKAVEARAAELIAEEKTLREAREKLGLTQRHVAEQMGTEQETISRIETRQGDVRLSTLRKYVKALGGRLQLMATFPGQKPIELRKPSAATKAVKAGGKRSKVKVRKVRAPRPMRAVKRVRAG